MRGTHFTVVSGEHEQRAFAQTRLIKRLEHLKNVPIDHRNHVNVILQKREGRGARVFLDGERRACILHGVNPTNAAPQTVS